MEGNTDPHKFEELATKRLRDHGFKVTATRKLVASVIGGSSAAINAYDIIKAVQVKGGCLDSATAYRILEVFEECGLIYRLRSESGVFPRLLEKGILIVDGIRISELSMPDSAIQAIQSRCGFPLGNIHIEVTPGVAHA